MQLIRRTNCRFFFLHRPSFTISSSRSYVGCCSLEEVDFMASLKKSIFNGRSEQHKSNPYQTFRKMLYQLIEVFCKDRIRKGLAFTRPYNGGAAGRN